MICQRRNLNWQTEDKSEEFLFFDKKAKLTCRISQEESDEDELERYKILSFECQGNLDSVQMSKKMKSMLKRSKILSAECQIDLEIVQLSKR